MRIAFLTPEYTLPNIPGGGLANYLHKISMMLKDAGHEPVIFLAGQKNKTYQVDGIKICESSSKFSRAFNKLPIPKSYRDVFTLWEDSRALKNSFFREHQKKKFDIIQAASFLSVGLSLSKNSPVPFISRVSSYSPLWRSAAGRKRSFAITITEWFEVLQLQQSDLVFAPSKRLSKVLDQNESIDCKVLPSPFEFNLPELDDSIYKEKLEGKEYLLYFGTLNQIKGVDILIDALPRILKDNPNINAVFVGRDNNLPAVSMKASLYLKKQLKKFEDRVIYPGLISREKLLPIIQNASLVILPSRIDNLPNTCLESQYFGRIVVGTSHSSLEELIEYGETGFLAENNNVNSLHETIQKALDLTKDEKLVMENNIQTKIQKIPSQSSMTELLELYQEVINPSK